MDKRIVVGGIILVAAICVVVYKLLQSQNFSISEDASKEISKTSVAYLDMSELKEWFNENKDKYPDAKMVLSLPDKEMLRKMNISDDIIDGKCLMQAFMDKSKTSVLKARFIKFEEMSVKLKEYFKDTNIIILK